MNIALLATAWGPTFGGINSFNQDLAIGLSDALRGAGTVYCAVLNATESEIREAAKRGIKLISLPRKYSSFFDPSWIHDVHRAIRAEDAAIHIDCWLGHDVISGEAALYGPEVFGRSTTALIHHMDYEAYKVVESGSSQHAEEKLRYQQKVFGTEHAVMFAVGPTLVDSCKRLTRGRTSPTMLIPGFPEFKRQNYSPDDRIVALASGRLDSATDRLKQGKLAIAAFGQAKKMLFERRTSNALDSAILYVVGTDTGAAEERSLYEFVDSYAGEAVNLLALGFTKDRETYFEDLLGANLAFMLSWHEGFGLVGWEAIAAGIPLVLSKKSGLFRLIKDHLPNEGIGGVAEIDIQAKRNTLDGLNFTDQTLGAVAETIIAISRDIRSYKTGIQTLRRDLVREFGCTWKDTANTLLNRLNVDNTRSEVHHQAESSSTSDTIILKPGLGVQALYRSFIEYPNTEILEDPGHLIVVMNDGRSWIRSRYEALLKRAQVLRQPTTIVLIHPKSDFLPILLRRNSSKNKNVQIQELRQAVDIVENIRQGGKFPIELRGHFLFNPSVIFATENRAVVMPYFVGSEGDMPALVLRSGGEETLHKIWWKEAQAIWAKAVPLTVEDFPRRPLKH